MRSATATLVAVLAAGCGEAAPAPWTAVTFNTGTTSGLGHDRAPDDGYGSAQAELSDTWYGDGLAWRRAVDDTAAFFASVQPDVVAFQEIFYSGECGAVPEEARAGFVCETWAAGDPTVAQVVLGAGYQVACHSGKPDKCVGVRRAFGTIEGCDDELCLDGLEGEKVEGCGGGARVARARVRRADGAALTVVSVHGSSGVAPEDQACRVAQFQQAFALVTDDLALVMGDLNTDPVRLYDGDESAGAFRRGAVAAGLEFITAVGEDAPPTYGGLFDIDHVLGRGLAGSCWVAGVSAGRPAVTEMVYFDHKPHVCVVAGE
ncbi:MAG: endonuclease/exonuclease/phosphatase family protein [Myxococcales bacterium]|nr:endonuclease/exonuclease/phosphatase family protein [Myxococcales bacterium]